MTTQWHPIQDGLLPVLDALDWFIERDTTNLHEEVFQVGTSPSWQLTERIDGFASLPTRRERLSLWLSFHGHKAEATDVTLRLEILLTHLRTWETAACLMQPPVSELRSESNWSLRLLDTFGKLLAEDYLTMLSTATGLYSHVRALALVMGGTALDDEPGPRRQEFTRLEGVRGFMSGYLGCNLPLTEQLEWEKERLRSFQRGPAAELPATNNGTPLAVREVVPAHSGDTNRQPPRDDDPTEADLIVGREVFGSMSTQKPDWRSFAREYRKRRQASSAKISKLLKLLRK